MMLTVHDEHVRHVLLTHATKRATAELTASGIEKGEADQLKLLAPSELTKLAASRELWISMDIDTAQLTAALYAIRSAASAQVLEAYFIQHGAPRWMLKDFFHRSDKNITALRRQHGVPVESGRPTMPDVLLAHRIHQVWRDMPHLNPRERYVRLHQAFPDIPIRVLAAVVDRIPD